MESLLPAIFVGVMGLALLLYVILDGYDLGVGLLLPLATDDEKDVMIAAIGPFWDANETWIVLGVGVLLIAFPTAHGIILTSLYIPATIMLFGLILRGVAFDFRVKAGQSKKKMWNTLFFVGSGVASIAQGWMLGSYITGLNGSLLNTIFSVLIAICLPALYCVLGACWLLIKTEGDLFDKATRWGRASVLPMAVGLLLVSIATPLVSQVIADRWFQLPNFIGLLPIPVTSAAALGLLWMLLNRDSERLRNTNPWLIFLCPVAICFMAALGLAYSIYPDIIIGQMSIYEAAAHPSSLWITLIGVMITLPCILVYTVLIYQIFAGKASELSYD